MHPLARAILYGYHRIRPPDSRSFTQKAIVHLLKITDTHAAPDAAGCHLTDGSDALGEKSTFGGAVRAASVVSKYGLA
jgi:hypothetical protein